VQRRGDTPVDLLLLVGLSAIGFSAVYFISDLIEVAQGNFNVSAGADLRR
jgi:hypothetical protein